MRYWLLIVLATVMVCGGCSKSSSGGDDSGTTDSDVEIDEQGCLDLDGQCNEWLWWACSPGYEPYSEWEYHEECWCCIPAPPSPCTEQENMHCMIGDSCYEFCWHNVSDEYPCEPGRVCCQTLWCE